MSKSTLVAAVFVPLLCGAVLAEYTFFSPPDAFTVEVSLENSPYLRLPAYRNAIVSLEVVGDYAVGGTAAGPGLSPFVFAVSLSKKRLVSAVDIATVAAGQRAVQSGFARGNGGTLYAGTIPDRPAESGHLVEVRLRGEQLQVTDRGVPVANEGIFSLAADPARGVVYGIAHPSGRFFRRSIEGSDTRVFEDTAPSRRTLAFLHAYAVDAGDVLSRQLILDRSGRVYGSVPMGKVFRYDPARDSIDILADELPETWGRKPLARVDCWAIAPDGALYGGNAGDGQLFRLDPKTCKIANLGKPAMMPRLRGLAFAADGRLYGVTGAAPGYTHLFVYDPATGFRDLGNPRFTMTEPGIEQGIAWRGFQLATLAASEDGRYIVMGEDETLSQLMVFRVGTSR